MKIICNVCYARELVIHNYDGKLYADPCSCLNDLEALNEAGEEAYRTGWDEGFSEGYELGLDEVDNA